MSSTASFDQRRQPTNATTRLSAILDKLAANGTNAPVADVLATVLNIKDRDPNRGYLLAFATFTRMLENSQKEVEAYLNTELEVYGSAFQPIRQCFNPKSSGQPWITHKTNLTATDVTAIRFTAQHLKPIIPEYEATDAELEEVYYAIDEMSKALNSDALSNHSREALRECLNEIKRAIAEYKNWGAAGLNQAFKMYTGTLIADAIVQVDLKRDTEKKGSLWDRAVKVGTGLSVLLSILSGAYTVAHDYLPTLEKLILPQSTITAPTIDGKPIGDPPDGATKSGHTVRL
jgi:hypothetical protein